MSTAGDKKSSTSWVLDFWNNRDAWTIHGRKIWKIKKGLTCIETVHAACAVHISHKFRSPVRVAHESFSCRRFAGNKNKYFSRSEVVFVRTFLQVWRLSLNREEFHDLGSPLNDCLPYRLKMLGKLLRVVSLVEEIIATLRFIGIGSLEGHGIQSLRSQVLVWSHHSSSCKVPSIIWRNAFFA